MDMRSNMELHTYVNKRHEAAYVRKHMDCGITFTAMRKMDDRAATSQHFAIFLKLAGCVWCTHSKTVVHLCTRPCMQLFVTKMQLKRVSYNFAKLTRKLHENIKPENL